MSNFGEINFKLRGIYNYTEVVNAPLTTALNLSSVGTITTGTWNATIVGLAYGGTNANLTASNGGIFYSTGSAGAILAGTSTANQVLLSGSSTTPAWSTATFPPTTTINQLLYSSSANTITGLATSTTAVLTTSSSVPTWATHLSLALGGTNAGLTASNGGIFYSTSSAGAILAGTATAGLALLSGASAAPTWSNNVPITKINTQVFTSTGAFTYTETTGTQYAIFELQGGGGGSGGTTGAAGNSCIAGAGCGGNYLKLIVSGSANLASITGSVGVGGSAGASGNNAGGAGGNTTLTINSGTQWVATGGNGGGGQAASTGNQSSGTPGATSTSTHGTNGTLIHDSPGQAGSYGVSFGNIAPFVPSNGGSSQLGKGGTSNISSSTGVNYGGGAGGFFNFTGANSAGAAGAQGIVIVTEFIST